LSNSTTRYWINVGVVGFYFLSVVAAIVYWDLATWSYEYRDSNGQTVIYTLSPATQICYSFLMGMIVSWLVLIVTLLATRRARAFARSLLQGAMARFRK
jgi:hypothetical protein